MHKVGLCGIFFRCCPEFQAKILGILNFNIVIYQLGAILLWASATCLYRR